MAVVFEEGYVPRVTTETAVPAQIKTTAETGVFDPLLTSDSFVNILDQFDLPTYTLKLSIKRENKADSTDEWVIAQSSVTATQIDNVSISTVSTGQATGFVSFRIQQPGHVTLMDDINENRLKLGLNLGVRPALFLEINFKGYTTDYEDNDQGGTPVNIAGPYIYKLIILDMKISITEEGSEYDFKCVIENFFPKLNVVSEIPNLQIPRGSNIAETCEYLRKGLKKFYTIEHRNYDRLDEYVFDFSDPSLKLSDGANVATTPFKVVQPLDSINDALTNKEDADKARIVETIEVTDSQIKILPGMKIDELFLVLLSMVKPFRDSIIRRTDGDDLMSQAKPEQTFVKWFRVLTDVEDLQWDSYRSDYARKFTYKLQLLDTARTDVGQIDEVPQTTEQLSKRFQDIKARGLLRKAYYYIFTGRNDQITNLDITFASGAALFNPPKYKFSSSAQYSPQLNRTESTEEDVARRQIEQQESLLANLENKKDATDEEKQAEQTVYASMREQFEEKFKKPFTKNYSETQSLSFKRLRQDKSRSPDFTQNGTYFGYSNNLFGYTAYQYHVADLGSSLFKVNMTVRGDPWYLGKREWVQGNTDTAIKEKRPEPNEPDSSVYGKPKEGCFFGDHTYFYLQFSTPRMDLTNYDDEDDDDGYVRYANKNGDVLQSFSGIYLVQSVTNTFSDGEFSSEIVGLLMTELEAYKRPQSEPVAGTI